MPYHLAGRAANIDPASDIFGTTEPDEQTANAETNFWQLQNHEHQQPI